MKKSIEEVYQHLVQKRIDLECKIAQQGLHRDETDISCLRRLNEKIKSIELKMFSAEESAKRLNESTSEHAVSAAKIFH